MPVQAALRAHALFQLHHLGHASSSGAGSALRLHGHRCTALFQPRLTLHTLFTAALQLRRLGDFSVVDEAGIAEPVESVDYSKSKLFLSGGCRCPLLLACSLRAARLRMAACCFELASWSQPLSLPPQPPWHVASRTMFAHFPVPSSPPAGVVYPKDGPTNKQTGRRCERFGPLESFTLDLSDKKLVQVGNHTCC